MVIGRGDICPSTASQSAEDTDTSHDLWQRRVRSRSKDIPQEDEDEPRARGDGDKDLEEGAFGVSIANSCRYGGEPFIGVAIVFVLDNLVVVQGDTDNQRTEESRVGRASMSPGNPFAIDLD